MKTRQSQCGQDWETVVTAMIWDRVSGSLGVFCVFFIFFLYFIVALPRTPADQ